MQLHIFWLILWAVTTKKGNFFNWHNTFEIFPFILRNTAEHVLKLHCMTFLYNQLNRQLGWTSRPQFRVINTMSVLFPSPLIWENYPSHSLEHQNMHCTIFNWSQVRLNHDCTYQSYLPSLWVSVDSKLTCRYCIKTDGHLHSNHGFFHGWMKVCTWAKWSIKPRPSNRNISMQRIATLLGATCYACLATLLWRVAMCCNICGCCMML